MHLMMYVAGPRGLRRGYIPSAPTDLWGCWDIWGGFPLPCTSPRVNPSQSEGPAPGFPLMPAFHSFPGGVWLDPPRQWVGPTLLLFVWMPRAVQSLSALGACALLTSPSLLRSICQWGFGCVIGIPLMATPTIPLVTLRLSGFEHALVVHLRPCRLRDAT